MNVTFSVPPYPQFKNTSGHDEYVKYENYMKRFQAYSVASLRMQVQSFEKAAEILAAGDGSRAMEIQMIKMNDVVTALASSAEGIVERSTMAVDREINEVATSIRLDVERVVSESVSEVKSLLAPLQLDVGNDGTDVCAQRPTCWQDASANVAVGKNNRRNRRRRDNRKTKQSASVVDESEADSVPCETGRSAGAGGQTSESVPEWRRKDARAAVHKGVFSECPVSVQESLRNSRAEMLVAKNEAAAVEARARTRQFEAKLKSRMIEEEVERARLEHEKKIKALREETSVPRGFAETVVSALETPSLSNGSVSPDSSISVAEVHKKDRAIRLLITQCTEKNTELDKLKARIQRLEERNNNSAAF